MTATPVLNNAADVICGSSVVTCDGSLISIDGAGTTPPPARVERAVPVAKPRRAVPKVR